MEIKNKSLLYCPDCGAKLQFSYIDSDGNHIYTCRKSDEDYYFVKDGEYLYCVSKYTGRRECYGLASQNN